MVSKNSAKFLTVRNSVQHTGIWHSKNSLLKSRLTITEILILFFSYPDRFLDFGRFIDKMTKGIEKLDSFLEKYPQSEELTNRRDFIISIREVWKNISQNVNHYDKAKPKNSLYDIAKEHTERLMERIQNERSEKNKKTDFQNDENEVVSSDGEGVQFIRKSQEKLNEKVICEYQAAPNEELESKFQRTLKEKLSNVFSIRKQAEHYRELIVSMRDGLNDMIMRYGKNETRIDLLSSAHSILNNLNSSSILERKFSVALRSCSDKRVQIRKFLNFFSTVIILIWPYLKINKSSPHIADEVLLECAKKEKDSMIKLAKRLNYNPNSFGETIDLISDYQPDQQVDSDDDTEEVIYIIYWFHQISYF